MSFSSEVKDELSKQMPSARHCRIAETAAIITMCGRILIGADERMRIAVHTESLPVARKYFTLWKKTFIINTGTEKVLHAVKVLDGDKQVRQLCEGVSPLLIKNSCCKRAYLRGAFCVSAP